ncbi:endonuclease/exonuclease/phosphatase family protein, partial [Nocardia salmonicida]|uniref:endonuclease/exonuclease/phosphatase family protein n=1 Tax=Nocardia salmonicida TaxID=53431 RepID=UPI003670816F
PLTWWSWAGRSFAKDVGWRVDHQLATPGLARLATSVVVDKEPLPAERLSDHAPLVVTYSAMPD